MDIVDLENLDSHIADTSPPYVLDRTHDSDFRKSYGLSILDLINQLPISSKLRKLTDRAKLVLKVLEIPSQYNEYIIFELPSISEKDNSMSGMEQSKDGHSWICYSSSTILGFIGDVRLSHCGGSFVCTNDSCNCFSSFGRSNTTKWKGRLLVRCPLGIVEKKHGGFVCFYCGSKPTCIALCHSQIYNYVIPEDIGTLIWRYILANICMKLLTGNPCKQVQL